MTSSEYTSSRIRRCVEEFFGIGLAESEPGAETPSVAIYMLALIVAMFSATAWYAGSIDLGFSRR